MLMSIEICERLEQQTVNQVKDLSSIIIIYKKVDNKWEIYKKLDGLLE